MLLSCPESLAPLVAFFEKTSLVKFDFLSDLYAPDAEFDSPLGAAKGLPELQKAFIDLIHRLNPTNVEIIEAQGDAHTGFLLWSVTCDHHGKLHTLRGVSHFKFNREGLVSMQRDCWDALFLFREEHRFLYQLARLLSRRVFGA